MEDRAAQPAPKPPLTPVPEPEDDNDDSIEGDAIFDIQPPKPLIWDVLDMDSTAVIYGESATGKSFVVLDWALSISTGTSWMGHTVRPGKALYVIGEGLGGTRARVRSWMDHRGIGTIPNMRWLKYAPNLLTHDGQSHLLGIVAKHRPVLTILDTVARHIPGGDENSFEAISKVVETLDKIRTITGGCALAVHHTGKDNTRGARGHSSLRAAMDTEILTKPGPTLVCTKQKNHEDGGVIGRFRLEPCGDSVVLAKVDGGGRGAKNDDLAIKALTSLGGSACFSDWKEAAVRAGVPDGSFNRVLERLKDQSLVILGSDPSDPSLWQIVES